MYDADGNRVKTTVTAPGGAAQSTNFLADTAGRLSQVAAETNAAGGLSALYVRAGDELLAVMRPGASGGLWMTRYVNVDGLGSVRGLTDETGVTTDTRAYEAFGRRNVSAGNDPLAYGYAGEALDGVSGLAYHRARWMDPRLGRFHGMDPWRGSGSRPQTLHRYTYAVNDPVGHIDPSGEFDNSLAGLMITVGMAGVLATTAISDTDMSVGADILMVDWTWRLNADYWRFFKQAPGEALSMPLTLGFRGLFNLTVPAYTSKQVVNETLKRLGRRESIRRLTIAAHGGPDSVTIGDSQLSMKNMSEWLPELAPLRSKFASDGSVYVQECYVAHKFNKSRDVPVLRQLADSLGVPVYGWTGEGNSVFGEVINGFLVKCTSGECTRVP